MLIKVKMPAIVFFVVVFYSLSPVNNLSSTIVGILTFISMMTTAGILTFISMMTTAGILTFISMINTISESLKAKRLYFFFVIYIFIKSSNQIV